MLTILPAPRSRIVGRTACTIRIAPNRLVSSIARAFQRAVLDRADQGKAGVVDEDIDSPSLSQHLRHAGLGGRVAGDVELQRFDASACGRVEAAARAERAIASLGQTCRDGMANPRRRAGHQCDTASILMMPFGPTPEISETSFDQTFSTNTKGVFFTVAHALPLLAPGSSVILTGSVAAGKGVPGHTVYSASKAAARSLARGWTAEVPPSQTRFNVISPGPIETPIYGKLGMTPQQLEQLSGQLLTALPVGRLGEAAEVAALALFLASDDSRFCCGADFFVDGGFGQT